MTASKSQKRKLRSGALGHIAKKPKKANVVTILMPQSEAREGAGLL